MYTIKRAAELTGVAVATLRAWERRYGIGTPSRTNSGYRLYDEQAISDINAMHHLIGQGWAPKQAAEEVAARRSRVRAAYAEPSPDLEQQITEIRAQILDAARAMDEVALMQALDQLFSRASFEHVVDNWLTPLMHDIGDQWQAGNLDIAGEHFVSNAVMRRLGVAFEGAPLPPRGPMVLVGMSENNYHEIGSLAFATAARRIGLGALYLGAHIPTAAWRSAVDAHTASAIVLSVVLANDVVKTQEIIDELSRSHPELVIAVGGQMNKELTGPILRFEGGIGASAAMLAKRLMG